MSRALGVASFERNRQSRGDCLPDGMLRHRLTLDDRDGRAIVTDERVEPLNTDPHMHDETAYYRPPPRMKRWQRH